MGFKRKAFAILYLCCLTHGFDLYAKVSAREALDSPMGSSLSKSGLGLATNGDPSTVDINPALLPALDKQFTFFNNLNFHSGLSAFEVGALDSSSGSVAAVLKFRQTTANAGEKDRRTTLGLAYRIPDKPLSLGTTVNYEQYYVSGLGRGKDSSTNLGIGALYQWMVNPSESPFFIGASITKLFDKVQKPFYNIGLSKAVLDGFYVLHLDGSSNFHHNENKIAGGVDIKAQEFIYLRGSVGRQTTDKRNFWGAGIYFDGPVLKASYSLAKNLTNDKYFEHSFGLELTL